MRCPELRGRRHHVRHRVRQHRQSGLRFTRHEDPRGELYMQVHAAFNALLGNIDARFAHVDELPWLVWECFGQEKAIAARDVYRAIIADGKVPNRVAVFLMGDEGELAGLWDRWCDESVMAAEVEFELTAYCDGRLDGTCAERIHKDYRRLALVATAGCYAGLASELRLGQNLWEYDYYMKLGFQDAFLDCLMYFKSVLQKGRFGTRKYFRGSKERLPGFYRKVYRFGEVSLKDWSDLKPYCIGNTSRCSRVTKGLNDELKKDFCRTLFKPQVMYSMRPPPRT